MAYWWWRRRRRAPRWRRRRWRTRRTRRRRAAFRRRGRRRRVRKRRGRWRRTYRKWRRGRKRRRHKRRLILTQWQPAFIRRCYIVGYLPLLICGENTSGRNFATHSDDLISNGPYGGGMTTTKFTLRILYDEHLRHLNYWTVSNEDLDLCRYLGGDLLRVQTPHCRLYYTDSHQSPFPRHSPRRVPRIHPGMLMLTKNKILIPSLKTRPNKKHKVKIRFRPPKLFQDKWYPQSELCDTTLLTVFATACDLQFPFGSPLTNNPCVNFQVLGSVYKRHLSILPDKLSSYEQHYKTNLYEVVQYYDTFQTIAQIKPSATQSDFSPSWNEIQNKTTLNSSGSNQSSSNDTWYLGHAYIKDKVQQAAYKIRDKYLAATRAALPALATLGDKMLEYHTGIYSSIFLSAGRSYFETLGAYTDIIYNPLVDKGIGNKLWLDPLSKVRRSAKQKTSKGTNRRHTPMGSPIWLHRICSQVHRRLCHNSQLQTDNTVPLHRPHADRQKQRRSGLCTLL